MNNLALANWPLRAAASCLAAAQPVQARCIFFGFLLSYLLLVLSCCRLCVFENLSYFFAEQARRIGVAKKGEQTDFLRYGFALLWEVSCFLVL